MWPEKIWRMWKSRLALAEALWRPHFRGARRLLRRGNNVTRPSLADLRSMRCGL